MKKPRRGRRVDRTGRSIGDGQYARITYAMLNSPAWRSLSGPAVKVFLELRSRFHGHNNGHLALSLDEAARLLAIGKATAQRAFKELQEKGFIDLTREGQWYGRLAATWRVTDCPTDKLIATNDWRRWSPASGLSVLQRTTKAEIGSDTDPSPTALGSVVDHNGTSRSISEPVGDNSRSPVGSETDRF